MSTIESSGTESVQTARPRALVIPLVIMVLVMALVIGGVFGWKMFIGSMMQKGMAAAASAPQTVSTVVAAESDWQARSQAPGSVRAVRGADLSAQASGVVDRILFESGSEVAAGATLLTLKPNDDPAKLVQLQAAAELAQITLKRDEQQLAAQAISQQTVDSDLSSLKSARAQVSGQQALIEEKRVRAPFAGTLGIRLIDEGQYLTAGTAVVTLQSLDPVYVDFYVPQQSLALLKRGQSVAATLDAYPSLTFEGKIASINSKVDSSSRNIQVRATFANADRRFLPGMYASVVVAIGDATKAITLPQTAITKNPYGDTVFVVLQKTGADGQVSRTVQQRFVKLGATRGDQIAITGGLAAGEVIVTAGQMKLHNGAVVVINNAVPATNDSNPTPPNE